jgi:hypothetical protein
MVMTLKNFVEEDSLKFHIFESPVKLTEQGHFFYKVESIEEKMLNIFPVRYDGCKAIVSEKSVGVFYRDHMADPCRG